MATQLQIEAEVKGVGRIVRVRQPFDEALQTLKQAGCKRPYVISARDLAYSK